MLAHGVHQAVGTAGGTLVGLFALSALGILTVGWHPLVALRTRETEVGRREAGGGGGGGPEPGEPTTPGTPGRGKGAARGRDVPAPEGGQTPTQPRRPPPP